MIRRIGRAKFLVIVALIFLIGCGSKRKKSFYLVDFKNFASSKTFNIISDVNITSIKFPYYYKGGELILFEDSGTVIIDNKKFSFQKRNIVFFSNKNHTILSYNKKKPVFKLHIDKLERKLKFPFYGVILCSYEKNSSFYLLREALIKEKSEMKNCLPVRIVSKEKWLNYKKIISKNYYIRIKTFPLKSATYQIVNEFSKNFSYKKNINLKKNYTVNFNIFFVDTLNFLPRRKEDFAKILIKVSFVRKNKIRNLILKAKRIENFFKIKVPIDSDHFRIEVTLPHKIYRYFPVLGNIYIDTKNSKKQVVILVSMDTVRAKSVSLYNKKKQTTPFLKSWAEKEATVYLNTYTTAPWTFPAHYSMLFGRYIARSGGNSIAEYFQKLGYYTIGFTGGGFVSSELGFSRGFLEYRERLFDALNQNSASDKLKSVVRFLKNSGVSKVFIFLHLYQAHSPYMPPKKYIKTKVKSNVIMLSKIKGKASGTFKPLPDWIRKNAEKLYEAEILTIDQELIKPLINYLKKSNLYDSSLLVITSDHGEQFFEHGAWEHGYTLYNEEVKIPLVIKFPGQKSAKIIKDNFSIAWLPREIVKGIGKKIPNFSWEKMSKYIFMYNFNVLKDNVFYFPTIKGVLFNNYKLINNIYIDKKRFNPPPHKFSFYELYNVKEDPCELNNIYKNVFLYDKKLVGIMKLNLKRLMIKDGKIMKDRKISKEFKKQLETLGYVK